MPENKWTEFNTELQSWIEEMKDQYPEETKILDRTLHAGRKYLMAEKNLQEDEKQKNMSSADFAKQEGISMADLGVKEQE